MTDYPPISSSIEDIEGDEMESAPSFPSMEQLAELTVAASSLAASADCIDNSILPRLLVNTEEAVRSLVDEVGSLSSALSSARADFAATARARQRRRSNWLSKHSDELDASEKSLVGGVRACDSGCVPLAQCAASLGLLSPLCAVNLFSRLSAMIDVPHQGRGDVAEAVGRCSRVQSGVSRGVLSGSGVGWCKAGDSVEAAAQNTISVECVDDCGEAVRGIQLTDLTPSIQFASGGLVSSRVTDLQGSVYSFTFNVGESFSSYELLHVGVLLFGSPIAALTVPVHRPIAGVRVSTFKIETSAFNSGLAVLGDVLAVSNWDKRKVHVYTIKERRVVTSFGEAGRGPGQLDQPHKMCFDPDTRNLYVTETTNKRVQEFTLSGQHVRFVGVGQIPVAIRGLDVNKECIVVGCASETVSGQIMVFDRVSGLLVKSFGAYGPDEGQLKGCFGISLSPLGETVAISEYGNNRVSLFKLVDGSFVSSFGKGTLHCPREVMIDTNGDILTADERNNLTFFSGVDYSIIKVVSSKDFFDWPTAMARQHNQLYILDSCTDKVEIFE